MLGHHQRHCSERTQSCPLFSSSDGHLSFSSLHHEGDLGGAGSQLQHCLLGQLVTGTWQPAAFGSPQESLEPSLQCELALVCGFALGPSWTTYCSTYLLTKQTKTFHVSKTFRLCAVAKVANCAKVPEFWQVKIKLCGLI